MPFDASQPFELLDAPPRFDPGQPHELVDDSYEGQLAAIGPDTAEEAAQSAANRSVIRLRGGQRVLFDSPEDSLKDFSASIDAAQEFIDAPLVTMPRLDAGLLGPSQRNLPTGVKVAAGVYNAAAALPEFFTTPIGAATLASGGLPAAAQRLIAAGFAVDMARHTPEQITALNAALDSGDPMTISETATSLGMTTAFIGMTAKHAATSPKRAASLEAARMLDESSPAPRAVERAGVRSAPLPRFNPDKPFVLARGAPLPAPRAERAGLEAAPPELQAPVPELVEPTPRQMEYAGGEMDAGPSAPPVPEVRTQKAEGRGQEAEAGTVGAPSPAPETAATEAAIGWFEALRNITIEFNKKRLPAARRADLIAGASELRRKLAEAGHSRQQIYDVEMGHQGVPLPSRNPSAAREGEVPPKPTSIQAGRQKAEGRGQEAVVKDSLTTEPVEGLPYEISAGDGGRSKAAPEIATPKPAVDTLIERIKQGKSRPEERDFADWRVQGSQVVHNRVGQKLTDAQAQWIMRVMAQNGMVGRFDTTTGRVILNSGIVSELHSLESQFGVSAKRKRETAKADEARQSARLKVENERAKEAEAHPATQWIDATFGADSLNAHNKIALGDYLTGKANKFSAGTTPAFREAAARRGFASFDEIKRSFESSKPRPTPPAETPPQAVAKVKEHVAEVARSEGPRPAKEIKSELIERLEKALDDVQDPSDKQQAALNNKPRLVGTSDFVSDGKGRGDSERIKAEYWVAGENAKRNAEWVKEVEATGLRRVTIDIPGDGSFTVWNTKAAVNEIITRAKKLSTNPTQPDRNPYPKTKPTGNFPADVWVDSSEPTHNVTIRVTEKVGGKAVPKDTVRKGRPIEIPGYEGKNLYLTSDGETFSITEPRNGLSIGRGDTISKAIESAKEIPDKSKFEGAVAKTLADQGERPPPTPIVHEAAPSSIDTGALGSLGMGGAKPGEFRAGASPTSIKNATVDAERQQRGLPPAMEPARRSFDQVWDEAMARVDQDPALQDRLIADLKERPRALTDLEDALLLHRQVDLQNEYGRLTRDLALAYDDAKAFPNRLEAVEELKVRVQEASNKLLELYDVNKAAGTETGRGLNARKLMAQEDFTLAHMEMELRAAKDGAPLTDAERGRMTALQAKIETVQKAFDDYVAKADAEKAQRAADESVRALREQVAKEPTYEPRVLAWAEQFVGKLERTAEKSDAIIRAMLARTSAGVDPTLLYHLGVKGAAIIARKGLDLARFTDAMISEYGESLREHMAAIWARSNQHLDREGAKLGTQADAVRRAVRKLDVGEQRTRILDGLAEAVKDDRPLQELGDYVRKLTENFVRSGITKLDPLLDAVHGELVKLLPDLTRRQAMDAISGYGQFKPLDPSAIKATLRDLRGQMQQVAKLEDITARQPALKTGVERRTPSNEERRLIAQVNEAKRRFGVVASDPARQLKGALDTTKTRLRNQIADLTFQISTREKIVRTRTAPPVDAEVQGLKTERDLLRAQFDAIFTKPGLTDAQRIEMAAKSLEISIQTYEARLASKDFSSLRGQPRQLISTRLDALRARRDALRAEFNNLRSAINNTPEAQLADYKARLLARTAEYQDRLARGDFEPPRRHDLRLDNAALRLKAAAEKAKGDWHHEVIKARLAQRTRLEKLLGVPRELMAAQRQLWTSFDLSSVFRQGGILSGSHPLVAARAGRLMLRALSTKQADIHWQSLLDRPNGRDGSYHAAKLFLSDPNRTTPSAVEENLRARWLHKFPGIKQSNQTYVTYLNELRASSFDILKSGLEARGTPLTLPELRGIANYINIATGRGELGRFAAAADALAMGFFAPRLVVSRFQYLLGQPFGPKAGSWRVRRAIAQEYSRSLGMLGVVIGLGVLAGASVEDDPRSSDFGKLKFGNTRLDMMGGLQQATVFLARNLTREQKNRAGEIKSLTGPRTPGAMGLGDVWVNFARSKQAPWINTVTEAWTGRDYNGRPVTLSQSALRAVAPLSFRDIQETMREQGIPAGTALSLLAMLGAGIGTEADPQDTAGARLLMQKLRGMPPEQREALRYQLEDQMRQERQQSRP